MMIPATMVASALQEPASVSVRITSALVSQFVALTGDCSSLHVSDTFARRSAYRRPVVHGMLGVSLLPLLPHFRIEGLRSIPLDVSARFVNPVFIDDQLRLTATPRPSATAPETIVLDFQIEREETGAVVTTGSIALAYEPRGGATLPATAGEQGPGMPLRPPELQHFALEEVEKGQTDTLDFRITRQTVDLFRGLLTAACDGSVGLMDLGESSHLTNLMALLLFSTSVGVCLPGSSATFLEFSAKCEQRIALDTTYRLEGRVAHRSTSTRIVKKDMSVAPLAGGLPAIAGRVAVMVNKAATRMPTVAELTRDAIDFGLKDKVVLVTGASRGIGETTAKLLALCGARVVVNYHRGADDAARVAGEITTAGGEAIAVGADVSKPEDVGALVQAIVEQYGGVDVLVNNAARDYRPIPFLSLAWDDVQKDLDVIAKGAFLCCQAVIPSMLARGGGKIVNISSIATDNPPPDQAKYVLAKSALVGLTRSLAVEFASKNIQVNMVVPTFVETDLVAHIPEGFRRRIAQDTPMRRNATPADVARAVVLLASSYTGFTTGQKIMVTGGAPPYL